MWASDLKIKDVKRFSRQIIVPKIGVEKMKLICKAKVLVIGMGGLGSPVLMYLATTGIKTIGIVDYDIVELHNLQRQVIHSESFINKRKVDSAEHFVTELNSDIKIIKHNFILDQESLSLIINDYSLVIDCTDNIETRYNINDVCRINGKPLILGSVLKWEGQICLVTPDSACYRCIFPHPKTASNTCDTSGVVGPVCGIVGSIMATETVKMITEATKMIADSNELPLSRYVNNTNMPGTLILINGFTVQMKSITKLYNKCSVCLSGKMGLQNKIAACGIGDGIPWAEILMNLSKYAIIDIRAPEHYKMFRVKESVNIPYAELNGNLKKIQNIGKKVVVSCYKGVSSIEASKFLNTNGVEAYSSQGGIEEFKKYIGFEGL